jgi:hypothetical protein
MTAKLRISSSLSLPLEADDDRPFVMSPCQETDPIVKEGQIHRMESGRAYVKHFLIRDDSGALCRELRVLILTGDDLLRVVREAISS